MLRQPASEAGKMNENLKELASGGGLRCMEVEPIQDDVEKG
jgi:hypothetical protein